MRSRRCRRGAAADSGSTPRTGTRCIGRWKKTAEPLGGDYRAFRYTRDGDGLQVAPPATPSPQDEVAAFELPARAFVRRIFRSWSGPCVSSSDSRVPEASETRAASSFATELIWSIVSSNTGMSMPKPSAVQASRPPARATQARTDLGSRHSEASYFSSFRASSRPDSGLAATSLSGGRVLCPSGRRADAAITSCRRWNDLASRLQGPGGRAGR